MQRIHRRFSLSRFAIFGTDCWLSKKNNLGSKLLGSWAIFLVRDLGSNRDTGLVSNLVSNLANSLVCSLVRCLGKNQVV